MATISELERELAGVKAEVEKRQDLIEYLELQIRLGAPADVVADLQKTIDAQNWDVVRLLVRARGIRQRIDIEKARQKQQENKPQEHAKAVPLTGGAAPAAKSLDRRSVEAFGRLDRLRACLKENRFVLTQVQARLRDLNSRSARHERSWEKNAHRVVSRDLQTKIRRNKRWIRDAQAELSSIRAERAAAASARQQADREKEYREHLRKVLLANAAPASSNFPEGLFVNSLSVAIEEGLVEFHVRGEDGHRVARAQESLTFEASGYLRDGGGVAYVRLKTADEIRAALDAAAAESRRAHGFGPRDWEEIKRCWPGVVGFVTRAFENILGVFPHELGGADGSKAD